MEIGEKIKRARQEAGITQAELARRLNVTPQTISQYERGLINPKYETALKFAEALDLQPSWLFGAKLGELETGNADKEHASHGMLWKLLNPGPVETLIQTQEELDVQRTFRKLNDEGQRVAIERVQELAQIPKYQRREENDVDKSPAGDDLAPDAPGETDPIEKA